MQEKHGIESTKILIKFAIDLYLHFTERKEKKGLFKKLIASLATFAIVARIDELFKHVKNLKKELNDIDEKELSTLRILVGEQLDVRGQKTDRLVKILLSFSVNVVKFMSDVTKQLDAKESNTLLENLELDVSENPLNEIQESKEESEETPTESNDSEINEIDEIFGL